MEPAEPFSNNQLHPCLQVIRQKIPLSEFSPLENYWSIEFNILVIGYRDNKPSNLWATRFLHHCSSEYSFLRVWPPFTSAPILALVIGINEYSGHLKTNLKYVVSDTDIFEDFLKKCLNASNKNIISLWDKQALCTGIFSGFMLLRDNFKEYKKNEAAIIIFYTGHGAQTNKPKGWGNWYTSSGDMLMFT